MAGEYSHYGSREPLLTLVGLRSPLGSISLWARRVQHVCVGPNGSVESYRFNKSVEINGSVESNGSPGLPDGSNRSIGHLKLNVMGPLGAINDE